MRVFNSASTTQQKWVGKWRDYLATHASTQKTTSEINGILMLCMGRGSLILVLNMAHSNRLSLTLPPMNHNYLPTVAEPSSRTTTRRCCKILCCIEMVEGAHFLHSLLCTLRSNASALNPGSTLRIIGPPAPSSHSIPVISPCPRLPNLNQINMHHLHHRMRCRRGGSRGHAIHPPSLSLSALTPSAASSPLTTSHLMGRYPATCSGRGRAQTTSSERTEDVPQPLVVSVPSMQPSHLTPFQFHCTLDHPCIIATVSVAFIDMPQSAKVSESHIQERTNTGKRKAPGSISRAYRRQENDLECTGAPQGGNNPSHSKTVEETTREKQGEEDDMEEYRCMIVEEPSPTNDTQQVHVSFSSRFWVPGTPPQ